MTVFYKFKRIIIYFVAKVKEKTMAKKISLGILAMVLVFGMTVIGCDTKDPDPCNGNGLHAWCGGTGHRTLGFNQYATPDPGGTYAGYWDNMSWYRYYGQKCGRCDGTGTCPICKGEGC